MKKQNLILSVFTMIFSTQAMALSLAPSKTVMTCLNDMRPVDGVLKTVSLEQNRFGYYDVVYSVSGNPWIPEDTGLRYTLAENLKCSFAQSDDRIFGCFKSGGGSVQNSLFNSKLSVETMVNHWSGKEYTQKWLNLEVASPVVTELGKTGTIPEIDSTRFKIRFQLNKCFTE